MTNLAVPTEASAIFSTFLSSTAADRKRLAKYALCAILAIAILSMLPDPVWAAVSETGSSDFDSLYGRLLGWVGGSLGKSLALVFLLVGLAVGILRGSLMAAVVSIGAGLALILVPTILESIFTAA